MRTEQDYKKLVKGYKLCLSVLKGANPKAYKVFMKAFKLLNENQSRMAQIVRQLRIDFVNEKDDLECGETHSIIVHYGIYREVFTVSYSPINDYTFGVVHEIYSPIGLTKRDFFELIPTTMEDAKDSGYLGVVIRESKLDAEAQVKKIYQYYAVITEETLEVLKNDLDKPEKLKETLSVKLTDLNDFQVDCENLF